MTTGENHRERPFHQIGTPNANDGQEKYCPNDNLISHPMFSGITYVLYHRVSLYRKVIDSYEIWGFTEYIKLTKDFRV